MKTRKMKMLKNLNPMDTAPKDGTPIDLWRPGTGWINDVWWDDTAATDPQLNGTGWVTICPGPFTGWRSIPRSRYAA